MRFFIWLSFLAFLHPGKVIAQTKKKYKINPGEKIMEVIPRSEVYSYPEFITGRVYLRNNTVSVVRLNYNSVFGEMQFINPKGDTLSMGDEKLISMILVNNDTFYYDNAYLKLVANEGRVKLVNSQFFEITNREKIGEFGQPGRGSVETYSTVSTQSTLKDLVINEIITITKKSIYYLGDEFNNFKVANKKNLLDMYGKNEQEVKAYLKENKVDFTNEKDLRQLVVFLKKITPTMPI